MKTTKVINARALLLLLIPAVFLLILASASAVPACPKAWTSQADWQGGSLINTFANPSGELMLAELYSASTWSTDYNLSNGPLNSSNFEIYNGKLYAGFGIRSGDARVISYNGSSWVTEFSEYAFQFRPILFIFNNELYAISFTSGKGWKYNGSIWVNVPKLHPTSQWGVSSAAVFNNRAFVGMDGGGIFSSLDGNNWDFQWLPEGGPGDHVTVLINYNGNLFAGLQQLGKIFVSPDGFSWTLSYTTGETGGTYGVLSAAVYNSNLYIGTAPNGKIFSFDGSTWSLAYDSPESAIVSLSVAEGKLYAGTYSNAKVYVYDGSSWQLAYDLPSPGINDMIEYNNYTYALSKPLPSTNESLAVYKKSTRYNTSGTWAGTHDAGENSAFTTISWSASEPAGTDAKMRIKAASTPAGLDSAPWSAYYTTSPQVLAGITGRYARVEATLETADSNKTPTLNDITIACSAAGVCGNTIVEIGEQCDSSNLAGQTCASQGYASGTLSCSGSCAFDTANCTMCGNNIVNAGEQCDGPDLNSQTCQTLGYGPGTLSCSASCAFNTSSCSALPVCGNGIVETGEQCDSGNLAGQTCATLGYDSGTLSCSASCAFSTSSCTTGSPDLIVENASFSPNPVTKGNFTNLTAAIKNQGTADAGTFYVALYRGDANGTLLQTQRVSSLAKNTTTSVTFAFIETSSLSTGSVAFTVFADYNSIVDENSSEANNQIQASLTVNPPPSGGYIDLIITDMSFSDSDVLEGETVDLTAAIKNQGTSNAGTFYVALYKGNTATGAIIRISNVSSLASGASTAVIFSDIDTELLSGQTTYTGFADYNNMVDENTLETNNQRIIDLFVTSTLPDLIISSLSSDKTIVLPSETVAFNVEISNTGQRAVASDVNIALYERLASGSFALKELKTLAKDFNCLQDDAYLGAAFCGRTAGDENTIRSLSFAIDTSGRNGLLEYKIEADYNNQVAESNENNNERNITLSIGIGPDLYFKRISKPCAIAGNEPISIIVEVGNKGAAGSEASSLKIHRLESGNEVVIADMPLQELSVGISETIPVSIPSEGLQGLVDIYFTIDPLNTVEEIDKANNLASATVLLQGSEICGNAKDDDADGLIDADDSDCTELCSDTIDNDKDGYVNEGCGEICYDLIDNDLDGEADEGCSGIIAEACGDATDNDMDCMVDEYCPFVLQAPLNSDADCLSDSDEILFGTNPEKIDTDGDCIDDCQEARYDHTDASDVNSNLIVLDITKRLMLGEKATIVAKHPTLGVLKDATATLYWEHKTAQMETDNEGVMSYKPLEAAEYRADILLCKNSITASFTAIGETTTLQSIVNFARSIFGSSITDSPLLLILLIILCGIAAILAYRNSGYFFPYEAKSSSEQRKEKAIRAMLSIAAFIVPLAVNRFLSINPALMLAVAEILIIFIFGYLKGQEYELRAALEKH